MASCRATRRWCERSPSARRRTRPRRVARTCWCFPILTAATSRTNWCSGSAGGRRSGPSSRAWRAPSPTCRAVRRPTILWTRRWSPSSSRGAEMTFSLTKDKRGVVVVGVDGQLIVGNRQDMKQKVLDSLDGGARKFVIDFTRTGYIDSSGLGVLVSLSKKIREQGGDLRLAGLNEDLQTLFELTKLDTLFAIAKTPAEALAAF